MQSKTKLLILYQVIFSYRLPIYNRISDFKDIDFELWHCPDMLGTKKINSKAHKNFKTKQLYSLVKKFKTNNSDNVIPVSPLLFTQLCIKNPNVILSEGASSLYNSSVAFIYCKIFRKKFIWWSLGQLEGRKHTGLRKMLNSWINFIERRADAIFTYSSIGEKYFLNLGIKPEKIFKAINVIDTDLRLQQIKKLDGKETEFKYRDKFNIVFVGSIIAEKKLHLLFETLTRLKKETGDHFMLHIIGDGSYLAALKEEFKNFGEIQENVIFYGRIEDKLSEILVHCDVLALPGLGGLSISEGMVHSLPIICGAADGSEKDLVDESNGYLFAELTADNMFDSISELYRNPDLKKKKAESSFAKITGTYSINNYMQVLENCINYVTKN
jgi:glycosyltransferase involved in cell wall biosynthesis